MANIYSLESSRTKARTKPRSRPHAKIAASILASARNGTSIDSLGSKITIPKAALSRNVSTLQEEGFLQLTGSLPELHYQTSGKGIRFLEAFKELQRMSSKDSSSMTESRARQEQSGYFACLHCAPHPSYPDIHPVTLHEDGVCLVCNERV